MIFAIAVAASLAAQAHFQTGLVDLYAYAAPQASAEFAAAARADPHLALAHWGEALAEGTDINTPLTPERFAAAQRAIARAAPANAYAPPDEQALIAAVAARYAGSYRDHERDEKAYRQAMEAYVTAHPNDDDAAMLLVEALMEDQGISWNDDGTTLGDTSAEILRLTQNVLARAPQQLMANHLCIHEYDNAPDRTPAIACAERLDAMALVEPEEHLAHMPAHTWIELGDGRRADASSERAWALHPTRYASHDAYVGLSAALMDGDASAISLWTARLAALESDMPVTPPAYVTLAAESERQGNIDAALQVLTQAAESQVQQGEMIPFFPADVRIGALLYRAGRYVEAESSFAETLHVHPRLPRALYGMWQTQLRLGNAVEAAQYQAAFKQYWAGGSLTMNDF